MNYIMEGRIETGYRYWIDQFQLGRKYKLDEIDIETYPYRSHWFGSFFETREGAEKALECLMSFLKYNKQLIRKSL